MTQKKLKPELEELVSEQVEVLVDDTLETTEAIEITQSQEELEHQEMLATATRLDNELEEFKNSLKDKTPAELLDIETKVIEDIEKNALECKQEVFVLPNNVVFRGKNYTRSEVEKKIAYFLNKQDVNFQMTLGMYELTDMFMRGDTKEVTYSAFDSVLRILGGLKFTGHTEWRDILIVNSWLNPIHNKYTKLTTQTMFFAQKHSILIDVIQGKEAMEDVVGERRLVD